MIRVLVYSSVKWEQLQHLLTPYRVLDVVLQMSSCLLPSRELEFTRSSLCPQGHLAMSNDCFFLFASSVPCFIWEGSHC